MKKLLIITVLVCFAGFQLFAVNPIPSYNVLVQGRASFQEQIRPIGGNSNADMKRKMNIQTSTASPGTGIKALSIVSITVYRLDHSINLGPYYIYAGQSLSVGIDFSAWGVDVVTERARVSVWASEIPD